MGQSGVWPDCPECGDALFIEVDGYHADMVCPTCGFVSEKWRVEDAVVAVE